ncbi:LemA family protein [Tindallia californiensis]|uniref:LemA protein n=1 Tax=Tindallia californiensis TaxID=159292 RepID=A0A1H3KBU1_9FIRM|nr:LemA family protein [Tindallia californiensis]SDY49175.1 LemA protein [Tindallia californiensis]
MQYVMVILAPTMILFIVLVIFYNNTVKLRNFVQNAWAQIDVQLKRRADLIPNLVETVKAYAAHEKETFEQVTRARAEALQAQSIEQRQQAENQLSGALKSLFAVAEAYPELKASDNFSKLQQDLSDTENKIAYSRQFYNDTAMKYNTKIQTFPGNVLAGVMGFQFISYFEAVQASEREAVQVRF